MKVSWMKFLITLVSYKKVRVFFFFFNGKKVIVFKILNPIKKKIKEWELVLKSDSI